MLKKPKRKPRESVKMTEMKSWLTHMRWERKEQTRTEKIGKAFVMHADSSAAIAIAKRQGAEKNRLINIGLLWIREMILNEAVRIKNNEGV